MFGKQAKKRVCLLALAVLVLALATMACGEEVSPTEEEPSTESPTHTAEPSPTVEPTSKATSTPEPILEPEPTIESLDCTHGAAFEADVTVPDNTQIEIGQQFTKIWRIRNTGTCDWGASCRLVFVDGDQMGGPDSVSVPETPAGASAEISVGLVAPLVVGQCRGYWHMSVNGTEQFGDRMYVQIVAFDPSGPTATAIPPTATLAPATQPPTETPQPVEPAPPSRDYLGAGVWRCPDSTEGAAYVGSTESDKFHYTGCRHAAKIDPGNRICFESREAAVNYGYSPCGVCKP
jgi:hypothetical protein